MELVFLLLLALVHADHDECGWAVTYYEFSTTECDSLKAYYNQGTLDGDQSLADAFREEEGKLSDFHYTPGFWLGKGRTFRGIDGNPANNGNRDSKVSLESTFPRASASVSGHSFLAGVSGIDFGARVPQAFCNGVKFTTSFGASEAPIDSVSSNYKISLDVSYARSNPNSGAIAAYNGKVVQRHIMGSLTHDSWANGLVVPHNDFAEIRVNPAKRVQQMSIFLFTFAPQADSAIDLLVSPFWVDTINGEANFNARDSYAYYFASGIGYSIGFRYGWSDNQRIGDLIAGDAGDEVIRFNRFGGSISAFDTAKDGGVSRGQWCTIAEGEGGHWFNPDPTIGFLDIEASPMYGYQLSVYEGHVDLRVKSVGTHGPGKLTFHGVCHINTQLGTVDRNLIQVDETGTFVGDPCGHVDILGFFTATLGDKVAHVKCISAGDTCVSPHPRTGHIGYCYTTVTYPEATKICYQAGGTIPSWSEAGACCSSDDRCSSGRDLIWINNRLAGSMRSGALNSADFNSWIVRGVNSGVADSRGGVVKFYDEQGQEYESQSGKSTAFMLENADLFIQAAYDTDLDSCEMLTVYLEFQHVSGLISSVREWRISNHFGVHVALFDLNNVDRNVELGDLDVAAMGFASFSSINYYSAPGMSSPSFGAGLPAMHGAYAATFSTTITSDISECCTLSVRCGDGSTCELILPGNDFRMCFPSGGSVELVYKKYTRSSATDLALYWNCPSHIAIRDEEDGAKILRFRPNNNVAHVAMGEAPIDVIANNDDHDDIARIVPPGCMTTPASPPAISIQPRTLEVSLEGSFFLVSLSSRPSSNVIVTFNGEYSFSKCHVTFTPSSWSTSKKIYVAPGPEYNVNTKKSASEGDISISSSSEDSRFDGVDSSISCSLALDANGFADLTPTSCQMDFLKRTLTSWQPTDGEMALDGSSSHVGDFVVFAPRSGNSIMTPLHVHARAESCGISSCVTAVGIQYGYDVISVYKPFGFTDFAINLLSARQSDIIIKDWQGCWVVGLPDGNEITICPNTRSYLDINIKANPLYKQKILASQTGSTNTGFVGSCFGDIVGSQNSIIKFPLEMLNIQQLNSGQFPKMSFVCSASNRDYTYINELRAVGVRPKPIATRIVSNPHDLGHPSPFLCRLSGYAARSMTKPFTDTNTLKTYCEGLNERFFYGAEDALYVSWATITYFHAKAYYDEKGDPSRDFFAIDIVSKNPRFCPLGKASPTGCGSCIEAGCHSPLGYFETSPAPCTSEHSVLIEETTGKIVKCYMGMCEYSVDGFVWEGLPSDPSNTPYCLTAISKESGGSVLWGFTNSGDEIHSSDFGMSWTPGTYNLENKESFTYAHTNSFDNVSPATQQGLHSVPDDHRSFGGHGGDRWWITPDELCVYSNRLAVTKSLIYCVRWWCECVDFDDWSANFGVDTLA